MLEYTDVPTAAGIFFVDATANRSESGVNKPSLLPSILANNLFFPAIFYFYPANVAVGGVKLLVYLA